VKRGSAIAFLLLVLSTGCASQRPEGVVERWLLSLNQGSAGAPDRYGGESATAAADAVLPDWRTRDPGSLDRVEVGSAVVTGASGSREATVPFRIETMEGDTVAGTARATECGGGPATGGNEWCVRDAVVGGAGPQSGSTWSPGAGPSDWWRAIGAAVVLCALAVGLVEAVSRRTRSARSA
jgi:hypothetical protein